LGLQAPITQVDAAHSAPALANPQVWPQVPQLAGSVTVLKPSSTVPLQLLSVWSQRSVPVLMQPYSQPSAGRPFRFTKPKSQDATVQAPSAQPSTACGRLHGAQPPQCSGSFCLS
jgi:hypothetical protein